MNKRHKKRVGLLLDYACMPIEVPEFPRLSGEKAIRALSDLIVELEKQRGNRLTDEQTEALIKIAK